MTDFILSATGDSTDRSAEIVSLLKEKGVCLLGPGTFFVSGVVMPPNSCLCGLGEATTLILLEGEGEQIAVTMGECCSVKNLSFRGAVEDLPRPETVGDRHAIAFVGTAHETKDSSLQPHDGIIDSCRIHGFSGGGILCRNTGYSITCSLSATNCRIHACGAGILIPFFSEFHKFTNVVSTGNLYGCVNNGGNNVFTACAFDGNTEGFLIDNSEGNKKNNAHGSCVGCTINHTNHNEGVGIRIIGSAPGFVFSACQLFYSKIVVEHSNGIQFDHFNCGKNIEIEIRGGGAVAFTGCIFSTVPTIRVEENDHVTVTGCTTKGGRPILYPTPENE